MCPNSKKVCHLVCVFSHSHLVFNYDLICQEYILKAVVNAALGQDVGSVSQPSKTE